MISRVPTTGKVRLTTEEEILLSTIVFHPRKLDFEATQANGERAKRLMLSLLEHNAIPEARKAYFTDPEYNLARGKFSKLGGFKRNGCSLDEILKHPNFLKYLLYFVYGSQLPEAVKADFLNSTRETGGNERDLSVLAKQQVRRFDLNPKEIAEEFYKLGLDCGLAQYQAKTIRNAVFNLKRLS